MNSRTQEVVEEKCKIEILLAELLPASVAHVSFTEIQYWIMPDIE